MLRNKKMIIELIKERVVILDGAMGSMLIAAGLPGGSSPESWNVAFPKKVQKVHEDYFAAGSDAVLTNTFGGTRIKLGTRKEGVKVEEYNSRAVEIARSVCPKDGYVAGDIGPTGVFLPPVGKATIDDFKENFLEQARILADAGVDLFFIETMYDVREIEAAIKAVKSVSNLPVFASMTFQATKRGFFTIMGDPVEKCVELMQKAGAEVVGTNCTIGSDEMVELIPLIKQASDLPIIAKPNAGKPELRAGETVYPTTAEVFAKDISRMVKDGARIVGGCCGTNPAFIKKIAETVKGKES